METGARVAILPPPGPGDAHALPRSPGFRHQRTPSQRVTHRCGGQACGNPVGKWRYLSSLFGRPTSQPTVENTVTRALNSRSASPPLRGGDNVRSLIQLRGLRPPVLPPRLRRSGRNFDPPERGASAPLPPALHPFPRRLMKVEAVPAAPSPQKRVSRGWLVGHWRGHSPMAVIELRPGPGHSVAGDQPQRSTRRNRPWNAYEPGVSS